MNSTIGTNRGLVSILGLIILGAIIILTLSYLHINIKSTVENPTLQENAGYVGGGVINLWANYLAAPFKYFWNEIVINIFWNSFISNMERIRDGKPTDLDKAAQELQVQQPQ